MRSRTDVLEFAILGMLNEHPMHGYELRKLLNVQLGSFRALSYGSLYPCLKRLLAKEWIATSDADAYPAHVLQGKRARIVYQLSPAGKKQFQSLLGESGPSAWEDENFDVRFAFFAQTDAETRLRILEGRRSRLTERLENVRQSMTKTGERMDDYTIELHQHGLDQVEREVCWLDGLIDSERGGGRVRNNEDARPRSSPDGGARVAAEEKGDGDLSSRPH